MPDDMGLLRTDVEIESPVQEGDRRMLRDVLVDTGAELSWAPAAVLESPGIGQSAFMSTRAVPVEGRPIHA
jgi:hypothetical protein